MRATAEIFKKELRDAYQGGKVAAGVLLIASVVPLTALALLEPLKEQTQTVQQTIDLATLSGGGVPYSSVRFHAFRKPSVLELFNQGVAADFPREYSLPRYAWTDPTARQVFDKPLISSLPTSDLRFIFQLAFPLLAIALSFSLISSESESGTLALLCSHPIPKRAVMLGKMAAGATLLAAFLMLAHVLIAATLLLAGTAPAEGFGGFLLRHFLASYLWVLFFFLLGALASAATLSSNQSAMLLLAAWALLTLVAPSALPSLATSDSRYVSEQQQYENAWPILAGMFVGMEKLADGSGLSFSRGLTGHLARQPSWSEVAVSLPSSDGRARFICNSDGTVVLRTSDEPLIRRMESTLPEYLRVQSDVGKQVFEIRLQRFRRLYEESERLDSWSVVLPIAAFNQISSSLAGTDAASYLEFVNELNRRKQDYFAALEGLSDFKTRRFFMLETGGKSGTASLPSPVWVGSGASPTPAEGRLAPWLVLAGENLILALAAVAIFLRVEIR